MRVARPRLTLELLALGALFAFLTLAPIPPTSDAANYHALDLSDPYRNRWAASGSFVYSPAFGQFLHPLTLLPFEAFYRLVLAINLVCLWWLLGLWAAPALLLPFVQAELSTGQIHLPIAVMIVLSTSYAGASAFGLLTKVTPGVTILWWLARREWKRAMIALVATAAIVGVSAAIWPTAWMDWLGLLTESSTRHVENFTVSSWPVALRLPVSACLVVLAAWRNRPAALPVIACFALPAIWFGALVMLLAIPRMVGWRSPVTVGIPPRWVTSRPRRLSSSGRSA
jgi:hypothetical protein